MPFENRRLLYFGCGILSLACLLYILANALPIWGTGTVNLGTGTVNLVTEINGLWTKCRLANDKWKCWSIKEEFSSSHFAYMTTARIFMIISCILSPFSVLSILSIILVNADSKRIMALLAKGLSLGSLIAGLLGVVLGIIFALKIAEYKIGVSGILGIIGVVFNVIGTIITFIIN